MQMNGDDFDCVDIFGISFPILSYDSTLKLFESWILNSQSHQVCIANVHTLVTSLRDPELWNINNNSLVTMDGMPLKWYANCVFNAGVSERVCGYELMSRCFDHGQSHNWRHFFLGSSPKVLQKLTANMRGKFPGLIIAGAHSPPYQALSEQQDTEIINLINEAKSDFLWVGLGAPKQEKWIAAHLDRIHVPVQIGVGAAFDFYAGTVKRAPSWLQKAGLEWFYRLLHQPRLLKRYLSTNPVFLSLFLKDFVKIRLLKGIL